MKSSAVTAPLYGLDIETDTSRGGLNPESCGVIAAALCGGNCPEGEHVLTLSGCGSEPRMLVELDGLLSALEPGILVTWNGTRFDLPFLMRRSEICGVDLGLRIRDGQMPVDGSGRSAGHSEREVSWHHHRHLDAFRAYRSLTADRKVSCALKAVALREGLEPVIEDASMVHLLDESSLRSYVASDARTARILAEMRWPQMRSFIDAPQLVASVIGS